VGSQGLVLHGNTSGFTAVDSGTTQNIGHVYGLPSGDLWATTSALGEPGTILHYDGQAWATAFTQQQAHRWVSIWASENDDVWAAANDGHVQHFDGAEWEDRSFDPDPDLGVGGIFGATRDDVWACAGKDEGYTQLILQWDGARFSEVFRTGTDPELGLIGGWANNRSDVWVGGSGNQQTGQLIHFDGQAWSAMDSDAVYKLWSSGLNDLWITSEYDSIVSRFDGSRWTIIRIEDFPEGDGVFGISGTSADDVWVTGSEGRIDHWDGSTWTLVQVAL
jgi:hypothetical protein